MISAGTSYDGRERSPLRNAEARVTLGVIAARDGDLEEAVNFGEQALDGERKSLPSLLMCSRELGNALRQADEKNPAVASYLPRPLRSAQQSRLTVVNTVAITAIRAQAVQRTEGFRLS